MKTDMKKQIIMNLPYLIVFYAGNKISWLFRVLRLNDLGEKILYAMNHIGLAFRNPLPSFNVQDILIGMMIAFLFKGMVYLKSLEKKKYRMGEEYGSARWSA